MDAPISPGDGLARAMPADLPDGEPYVLLPEPLALNLRESHLAVGVYLLVARLYLIHQAPIPLSATDIDVYDGSGTIRRGATLRALGRLCSEGWLIAHHRRGQKASYLPAWGLIGGTPRPWDLAAPGLDRPRGVRAVRVPRVALDVCLGRLTPHHRHAALITRYVTRPPLSLRDVGAYGLLWAGLPQTTDALIQLGLASVTAPLPPPSWAALLARISQRPLFETDPAAPSLSPRGLQRAGLLSASPAPSPESPPLFFVPKNMIGGVIPLMIPDSIAPLIGSPAEDESASSAAETGESPLANAPPASTANQGTRATEAHEATPSPRAERSSASPSGNKRKHGRTGQPTDDAPRSSHKIPPAAAAPPAEAPTAAERALCELGVYPSIARQHRDLAPALVERALTIARRLPGRTSLPATLAQLLREEQACPGWLRQGRPDLFLSPMREDDADTDHSAADAGELAGDAPDPRASIYALLCAALDARLHLFIERERIDVAAGLVSVALPTWFSQDEQETVYEALRDVAAQLGLRAAVPAAEPLPPTPSAAPSAPAPAPVPVVPPRAERPGWISPEQWGQLHLLARGALSGSYWEQGEIMGSGPGTTRMLRTSLANLVARLRAPGEHTAASHATSPARG